MIHLLLLEKNPNNMSIINEIFRSAHTLKGMSATMGYEDLAKLTHKMENVLDAIRNQSIPVTAELLDVVFLAVDDLEAMVQSIASGGDGKRDVSNVVGKLKLIEEGKSSTVMDAQKEVAVALAESELETVQKVTYDEFERTVIEQSKEQGFSAFEIMVSLREDCVLKAARVYMVFGVLGELGEIIKSTPPVEQLEEEQFDHLFTVTLISKEDSSDIEKKVMKVSEIEKVEVTSITLTASKNEIQSSSPISKTDELEPSENKVVPIDKTTPSLTNQNENDQNKNHATGKTASKTIRVNIERLDILLNLFEELVIDRGRLEQISSDLNNQELQETVDRMSRITGDLQNIILNMRMVPIDTVFNRFPRMVRQLQEIYIRKSISKLLVLKQNSIEPLLMRLVIHSFI